MSKASAVKAEVLKIYGYMVGFGQKTAGNVPRRFEGSPTSKETCMQLSSPMVALIVGSKSDLEIVERSGMKKVLDKILGPEGWTYAIISAHRNPDALIDYCRDRRSAGVIVFIAAAGMSAALPGAVAAAINFDTTVIGVALPSSSYPDAHDSVMSMTRHPKGVPVMFAGTGEEGLYNAAIAACQIIVINDRRVGLEFDNFLISIKKQEEVNPPKYLIDHANDPPMTDVPAVAAAGK